MRPGGRVVISDVHPVTVMLGAQGSYRRNGTELGFVRNHVHLASDYLRAFRAAGLDVVQCLEPLWGEQEIAAIRFAGEMPDLVEAAAKGLPSLTLCCVLGHVVVEGLLPLFPWAMAAAPSFLYAASSRHVWRSLTPISPDASATVTLPSITPFNNCILDCSLFVNVSPLMD